MAANANGGILVPGNFSEMPPEVKEFSEFFQQADELGFHSLWFTGRIFHNVNILDPLTLLSCAATVTSRPRLPASRGPATLVYLAPCSIRGLTLVSICPVVSILFLGDYQTEGFPPDAFAKTYSYS